MMDPYTHAKKNAQVWCQKPFDSSTQKEVLDLLNNKEQTPLLEAFYQHVAFGTGGIRNVMGVGTNRINTYTLAKCTQGLSNYLKRSQPNKPLKAVIAYDTRKNSQKFAEETAQVFSANGIKVFLFESYRPTPQLSFAIKELECDCGIVITASHNPPQDNGYKVYWNDGGQIAPPIDQELIQSINELEFSEIQFDAHLEQIELVGAELDEKFAKASVQTARCHIVDESRKDLNILFTPLHGATKHMLPKVFQQAGFSNLHLLQAQATTDGTFSTVTSPNPEDPESFDMAIAEAKHTHADLILATDPDGDRMGVAIKNTHGTYDLLNGSQLMCLMGDFILKHTQIESKHFIASTLVSTPMFGKMANKYGVKCLLGLTGFKWINKMISDFPELKFLFGGEESYGYMVGDFVADKDSITSALILCELASRLKQQGKTLMDQMLDLYLEYGLHYDTLFSIKKEGLEGLNSLQSTIQQFRNNPPKHIAGFDVQEFKDFAQQDYYLSYGKQLIPKSNMLMLELEGGNTISLRPSGTEPKLKAYINLNHTLKTKEDFQSSWNALSQTAQQMIQELNII